MLRRLLAQVQMIVGPQGLPLWWDGVHVGNMHDARMWQRHGAVLPAGETVLADKGNEVHTTALTGTHVGYQGCPDVIHPVKTPPASSERKLSADDKAKNTLIQ